MKISFESVGDFEATTKWLKKAADSSPSRTLNEVGEKAVRALSSATPVGETGETSRGWEYKVESDANGSELSLMNTSHPESVVNVAVLIDKGHATGNGGYVQPRPYIRQTMDSIFEEGTEKIVKEMTD